ncbi:hypothetical protein [Aureliella helgolandensis]|uniref:Uncharacterized protein n=1 Tax=Aureliella helgolandensis TaxID=2527968 RepID=A0A518FZJ7_9BACT|nr:hypothetical protein [Aureliella helgolandensis]QDV21773.1 hypothetical protein Q31a_00520 [Aureliella helgolandensis]|tara:strand:+ start:371 stop:619 length:249 start_codon:yes stop_codon:yes gene_type:complete
MQRTSSDVLSQEFLQIRAKILEIGAFFDRLAEAGASPDQPQPKQLLDQGCAILTDDEPDKAARIQLLFSREYDADWRDKFGI